MNLPRNIDPANLKAVDESKIIVEWDDFERAVQETVPAFGSKNSEEMQSLFRNGLVDYGKGFSDLQTTLQRLINQCRTSAKTPLLSVLLEGPVGTGKTALAASICANSEFPFIRLISPDTMIGKNESQKCSELLKVFSDAYRSMLSVILIDDIERILYVK
jgi:vesicle-fusing ATPase